MDGKSLIKHYYLNKKRLLPDYMHAKKVCKDFEIKKLDEYSNFHLKSNTLLLSDVFGNFRKMCLKAFHLDVGYFFQILD